MTDEIDAYLQAHGYTRRMIRREKAAWVAAYVLVGIMAGWIIGAGMLAVTEEAW